jgi:hypothetical protein
MKKLPEGHLDRYDWTKASRGRFAKRLSTEHNNLRALDEDVADAFPDSASVNAALRAVMAMRIALAPVRPEKRTKRAA